MSSKRTRALWDASSPALTPTSPTSGRTNDSREVHAIKALLYHERKRHAVIEAAFARYQIVLETTLAEQREAIQLLGKALAPAPAGRKQ
jgi:hypothetical protein